MVEYIIVGDTERYDGCLIYTCGRNKEHAEKVLERMLTNPDKNDLHAIEEHKNLRIEETKSEDAWWNDPFLAN